MATDPNANNNIIIESPGVHDSTVRPTSKSWPPKVSDPNTYDPNVIKSGDVTNQNLRGKLDPVILSFEHKPTGEIHHIAVPAQNANPADLHAALQAGEYV